MRNVHHLPPRQPTETPAPVEPLNYGMKPVTKLAKPVDPLASTHQQRAQSILYGWFGDRGGQWYQPGDFEAQEALAICDWNNAWERRRASAHAILNAQGLFAPLVRWINRAELRAMYPEPDSDDGHR